MNKGSLIIGIACMLLTSCGSKDAKYDAMGMFEATEVLVSAKSTGEIISLNYCEGDSVSLSTEIGCIDTTMLTLQRKVLLANQSAIVARYIDVSSQVATLRQRKDNLSQEKERFERLLQKGASSQKQVDGLAHQISVLEKQISAIEDQYSSANKSVSGQNEALKTQVLQIQKQIDDCRIKSPIDGIITAKFAEKVEFTATGKPLLKVADIRHIYLRAYIVAPQLTMIKLGDKVKVFADYGESGSREYEGPVSWISDKAEFTPKTIQTRDERANLVYAIKIAVENDGMIKRGMYGSIS